MMARPAYRHFWAPPPALIGPSAKCLGWLFGSRLLHCAGSWLVTAHCTTCCIATPTPCWLSSQNIACNRLHSAEERTARWLAQTHDRVGSDIIQITQEFLAQMLGVRRATVSVSARILQRAGLIRYNRGCVTILDRAGLRRAACDCYLTIRREFDKLR